MNSRVVCVIVLVSLVREAVSMCFEPSYITSQYHIEQYTTAPYILVGRVLEIKNNSSHQAVKIFVNCVYKSPLERPETLLHQEMNITMEFRRICEPLLKVRQNYFFFLEEKISRKNKRRRKKKKNHNRKNSDSDDFIRISLGAPIPVPEMDIMALERLVEHVKEYNPVGRCYNVWSGWSSCSTKCGVGTMERTYPRHQEGKTDLQQIAVCHNAPCDMDGRSSDTDYQYQPISINNCKSLELVRVRWCTGTCPRDAVRTALSWEIYPTLMLCTDHSNQEGSLRYHNVAIPSSCGCKERDAPADKFAVIEGPCQSQQSSSNSKKRNLKEKRNLPSLLMGPGDVPVT